MNFLSFNTQRLMGVPFEDMGMLFKGGSEKQKTESNSTSVSTPHQQAQYDKLLSGADKWVADGGFDKNYGGSADFDPVANLNQGQLGSLGNQSQLGQNLSSIYNGSGTDALKDVLGTYDPSKTGLNDALAASNERMNFDYNTQVAPSIRQGAQGAGQFGSSRHGIAEGLGLDRLSQNQAAAGAQMAFQDQQNWNNNRNAALQNLSGITSGLNSGNITDYNANAKLQSQEQSEKQGQLEAWAYKNNVSLNDLAAYQQLISGDMGGVNTTKTTSTSTAPKTGGGALQTIGTVGGAVLGGMFGGPAGAMAGSAAGGAIGGAMS